MKLFVSFGSWGEIAPLLEIALRLKEQGESVEFATTQNWSSLIERYGVKCHSFANASAHEDNLDDFIRAHFKGRMQSIFEVIEEARPDSIVASFYAFPAHAYVELYQIPILLTTTSPCYFMNTEMSAAFRECFSEYRAFREKLHLKENEKGFRIVGLYPWYLAEDIGVICIGFPSLRALEPLDKKVVDFIKEPYGVITRGTLIGPHELDRMVNAIKAHGLKCLYLGKDECDADLSIPFCTNHFEAVRHAKVAITHGGVGTLVDCMGVPMVVDPIGYDQYYNAQRLIELKVAVSVNGSYIRAIDEALKPRSFLPNYFSLGYFDEYTPSDAFRHAADVGERAQIH